MRYKRTTRAELDDPSWPLTAKDMIWDRVQIEDAIRHRNAPKLPLPKDTLKDRFEMTLTSAYAFAWDAGKRTIDGFPGFLRILRMALP